MFRDRLRTRVSSFYALSSDQLDKLELHYELMLRWNKIINLTRIVREEDVVDLHYAESLFLAVQLPAGNLNIADLGSGAGFPGYPVAVIRPECSVWLIEAHQRKSVFLKEVSRRLGNLSVLASRAEDVNRSFDWVISRAVSTQDLEHVAFRLAPNLALLGNIVQDASVTVPIPWAQNRNLVIVSRETRT